MNILWIQSGKIVEVDQKSLKTYLTALLRCLAPFIRRKPRVRPVFEESQAGGILLPMCSHFENEAVRG
jgi:hypothetical protein